MDITPDYVAAMAAHHNARIDQVAMFRDYNEGRHSYDFASKKFVQKFGWALRAAQENLCPAVVSAYVDRLSITTWGNDLDEAQELGLQRLANLVHAEAHVTGDAYAITWKRPGTEKPNAVFHRADQATPDLDPEQPDQLRAITKWWVDGQYARANVYTANHLYRFRSTSTLSVMRGMPIKYPDAKEGWAAYEADGQPAVEPHTFGVVPAVWWRRSAPSQFDHGVSILRDVISPQNRLNKITADAVVSSETIAAPLRYVMDVAPELLQPKLNTATGQLEPPKLPFDETINSILALTAKGPAGQFPGPDADKVLAMKNDAEQEIARVAGVPAYYLSQTSGDVPSGESLRVLSSRLIAGVSTFQQDATPAWKGQLELLGFTDPTIEWADPQPMDAAEKWQIATIKHELGYSLEDILNDLGEADVEGVLARAQARSDSAARAFRDGETPFTYEA